MDVAVRVRLETAANVAILVAAAAILVNVTSQWRTRPSQFEVPSAEDLQQIPGLLDPNAAGTLLLAVDDKCHYCESSLPFYATLAKEASQSAVRIVAVGTESPERLRAFLAKGRVVPDQALQVMADLGIRVTPVLLLADSAGKVQQHWVGQLRSNQEAEVLAAVRAAARSAQTLQP